MIQINELIKNDEYKFLYENEHLKNKLIFLCLGGSHAYGTNIETSDIDLRGCVAPSVSDLIGFSEFSEIVETETDTTIYEFNKLIKLLLNNNPNTIELLGLKKEHYLILNPIGEELIKNKKLFLSQKCFFSFKGYAQAQLRRLQNALANDRYPQAEKEVHILKSLETARQSFNDRYESFNNGDSFNLFLGKSNKTGFETEIKVKADIKEYPLRDFRGMFLELLEIAKNYDKLNNRNTKKDDLHLNKHAMHLVRLYLMCLDILEKEDIITYREMDLDLLMNIRNGNYQKVDGTYRSEFFDMITELERKIDNAYKNTNLPNLPDEKKIEEFVIEANKKFIMG
jgi:predicted nucleotidyltransferase